MTDIPIESLINDKNKTYKSYILTNKNLEEFLKLQSLQEQISGETESSQHVYYKGL